MVVLPKRYFVMKTTINNHPDIITLFVNNNLPLEKSIINISSSLTNKFVVIYSETRLNKQYINYTMYESDISKTIVISFESIKDMLTNDIITYQYDLSQLSIENDKYTILYLNDINNISQYSTDITLSKAFNVLYPEIITCDSIYTDCRYADKIYNFSSLGVLKKMDILLTNSTGKPLTVNIKILDYNVPVINSMTCICQNNSETGNLERDYKCLCNYIRHPKYIKMQIDLMFKFGIIETEFDKRIFN